MGYRVALLVRAAAVTAAFVPGCRHLRPATALPDPVRAAAFGRIFFW